MYYDLKVNIVKFENFSANDTNYGNLGLLGLRNTKSSRSKSFCLWWLKCNSVHQVVNTFYVSYIVWLMLGI